MSKTSMENLRSKIFDLMGSKESYLLGKVLTIIDASISDPEQRKGIKDLVKDAFYSKEFYTSEMNKNFMWFAEAFNFSLSDGSMPPNSIEEKNPFK